MHTSGGYALFAAFTTQTSFALEEGDIFACVADCGWVTGHSYVVYGPLLNGSTTFLFESTPVYPDPGRYWDMVQRHKITQFYTAPTAIRLLMRYGDEHPAKYDTSSLKVLGTVGEVRVWNRYSLLGTCPLQVSEHNVFNRSQLIQKHGVGTTKWLARASAQS